MLLHSPQSSPLAGALGTQPVSSMPAQPQAQVLGWPRPGEQLAVVPGVAPRGNRAVYESVAGPAVAAAAAAEGGLSAWLLLVPDHSKMALAKAWHGSAHRAQAAAAAAAAASRTAPADPVTRLVVERYLEGLTWPAPPLPPPPQTAGSGWPSHDGPHHDSRGPDLQYGNQLYDLKYDPDAAVEAYGSAQHEADMLDWYENELWQAACSSMYDEAGSGVGSLPRPEDYQAQLGSRELRLGHGPMWRRPAAAGQPYLYGPSTLYAGGGSSEAAAAGTKQLYKLYNRIWHGHGQQAAPQQGAPPHRPRPSPLEQAVRQGPLVRLPYPPDLLAHVSRCGGGYAARPPPPPLHLQHVPPAALRQAAWLAELDARRRRAAAAAAAAAATRRRRAPAGPTLLTNMYGRDVSFADLQALAQREADRAGGGGGGGPVHGSATAAGQLPPLPPPPAGAVHEDPHMPFMSSRGRAHRRRMEAALTPVFAVNLESREVRVVYLKDEGAAAGGEAQTQTVSRRGGGQRHRRRRLISSASDAGSMGASQEGGLEDDTSVGYGEEDVFEEVDEEDYYSDEEEAEGLEEGAHPGGTLQRMMRSLARVRRLWQPWRWGREASAVANQEQRDRPVGGRKGKRAGQQRVGGSEADEVEGEEEEDCMDSEGDRGNVESEDAAGARRRSGRGGRKAVPPRRDASAGNSAGRRGRGQPRDGSGAREESADDTRDDTLLDDDEALTGCGAKNARGAGMERKDAAHAMGGKGKRGLSQRRREPPEVQAGAGAGTPDSQGEAESGSELSDRDDRAHGGDAAVGDAGDAGRDQPSPAAAATLPTARLKRAGRAASAPKGTAAKKREKPQKVDKGRVKGKGRATQAADADAAAGEAMEEVSDAAGEEGEPGSEEEAGAEAQGPTRPLVPRRQKAARAAKAAAGSVARGAGEAALSARNAWRRLRGKPPLPPVAAREGEGIGAEEEEEAEETEEEDLGGDGARGDLKPQQAPEAGAASKGGAAKGVARALRFWRRTDAATAKPAAKAGAKVGSKAGSGEKLKRKTAAGAAAAAGAATGPAREGESDQEDGHERDGGEDGGGPEPDEGGAPSAKPRSVRNAGRRMWRGLLGAAKLPGRKSAAKSAAAGRARGGAGGEGAPQPRQRQDRHDADEEEADEAEHEEGKEEGQQATAGEEGVSAGGGAAAAAGKAKRSWLGVFRKGAKKDADKLPKQKLPGDKGKGKTKSRAGDVAKRNAAAKLGPLTPAAGAATDSALDSPVTDTQTRAAEVPPPSGTSQAPASSAAPNPAQGPAQEAALQPEPILASGQPQEAAPQGASRKLQPNSKEAASSSKPPLVARPSQILHDLPPEAVESEGELEYVEASDPRVTGSTGSASPVKHGVRRGGSGGPDGTDGRQSKVSGLIGKLLGRRRSGSVPEADSQAEAVTGKGQRDEEGEEDGLEEEGKGVQQAVPGPDVPAASDASRTLAVAGAVPQESGGVAAEEGAAAGGGAEEKAAGAGGSSGGPTDDEAAAAAEGQDGRKKGMGKGKGKAGGKKPKRRPSTAAAAAAAAAGAGAPASPPPPPATGPKAKLLANLLKLSNAVTAQRAAAAGASSGGGAGEEGGGDAGAATDAPPHPGGAAAARAVKVGEQGGGEGGGADGESAEPAGSGGPMAELVARKASIFDRFMGSLRRGGSAAPSPKRTDGRKTPPPSRGMAAGGDSDVDEGESVAGGPREDEIEEIIDDADGDEAASAAPPERTTPGRATPKGAARLLASIRSKARGGEASAPDSPSSGGGTAKPGVIGRLLGTLRRRKSTEVEEFVHASGGLDDDEEEYGEAASPPRSGRTSGAASPRTTGGGMATTMRRGSNLGATAKMSRLGVSVKSDQLGAGASAGGAAADEDLMSSIRQGRQGGARGAAGHSPTATARLSAEVGAAAAGAEASAVAASLGGWAMVQQSGPKVSTAGASSPGGAASPLGATPRSLAPAPAALRAALGRTATLVRGVEAAPARVRVPEEREEGEDGGGGAAAMVAALAELGLPPSKW